MRERHFDLNTESSIDHCVRKDRKFIFSFLLFSFFIRCYLRIVLNALFSLHKRSSLSVPRFCSILKANEISEDKSEEYDYVREVHDSK